MSKGIIENNIVENNVRDTYSTYVKCDCGEEILGFQAHDQDLVYKSELTDVAYTCLNDPTFELHYYGVLNRHDMKYGYNNFYFIGTAYLRVFIKLLKEIVGESIDEDINETFYDETLPHSVEKKYGRGGICVVHYKDDVFTYIQKYRNLKKKKKISWEIVLKKDNLKVFIINIEQIIKKIENVPLTKDGWVTALPV